MAFSGEHTTTRYLAESLRETAVCHPARWLGRWDAAAAGVEVAYTSRNICARV